ncbi:hypothetical protein GTG28_02340 [Vibrio sp. OCN044]|uniref:YqcI/YcgG family protein n=1 Tax=Vibrio tetraodonis subsp. pristinus TaxID=2695891 RepID=A0A6L8LPS9_9VIBR|nr:YqcI/YcgG family protein [Vibrio tetraodonis]MYM58051.1 hypothetical protein [Vibrio tetraodonis subsp. pristinus]
MHNRDSELFRKQTHCIFAPQATFWKNKSEWNTGISIEENIRLLKSDIDKYVEHIIHSEKNNIEPIDSFVIEAPAEQYSKTMGDVAEWLYRILNTLSPESIDKLKALAPMEDGSYSDDGWEFRYGGVRFFVLTTTPLYEEWHSRYCGGDKQKSVIIHLQPMYSFDYNFNKSSIGCPVKIVKKIRSVFTRLGRDYENDFSHTVARGSSNRLHEAPKYLKPQRKGDPIIKWWVPRPFELK